MSARPRSSALGLGLAASVLACGGIEPLGPNGTSVQTESDGCTPESGEAGAGATVETGADESGPASTSGSARPSCDETGACMPGLEGCPCTGGGTCDAGLMCISSVCVAMPCPIGTEGCPCTQGGACDPELTCVDGECV